MQVDEARAGQSRGEVVAARADAFQEAAPALTLLGSELFGGICPVDSALGWSVMTASFVLSLSDISRPPAARPVTP